MSDSNATSSSASAAKRSRLEQEKGPEEPNPLQMCFTYEDEGSEDEDGDKEIALKNLGYQDPKIPADLSSDACIAVYEKDTLDPKQQIFYEGYEFAPVRIFYYPPKGVIGFKCRVLGRLVTLDLPTTKLLLNFLDKKMAVGSGYIEWANNSRPDQHVHMNTFVIARTEDLVLQ